MRCIRLFVKNSQTVSSSFFPPLLPDKISDARDLRMLNQSRLFFVFVCFFSSFPWRWGEGKLCLMPRIFFHYISSVNTHQTTAVKDHSNHSASGASHTTCGMISGTWIQFLEMKICRGKKSLQHPQRGHSVTEQDPVRDLPVNADHPLPDSGL